MAGMLLRLNFNMLVRQSYYLNIYHLVTDLYLEMCMPFQYDLYRDCTKQFSNLKNHESIRRFIDLARMKSPVIVIELLI